MGFFVEGAKEVLLELPIRLEAATGWACTLDNLLDTAFGIFGSDQIG